MLLLLSGRLQFRLQDNDADEQDAHDNGAGPRTPLSAGEANRQQPPSDKGRKGRRWQVKRALGITDRGNKKRGWQKKEWLRGKGASLTTGHDEGEEDDTSGTREGGELMMTKQPRQRHGERVGVYQCWRRTTR
jgi:hypothetical protein